MFKHLSVKLKIAVIALVGVMSFGCYLMANLFFSWGNQTLVDQLKSQEIVVIMQLTRLENLLQIHEMLLADAGNFHDQAVVNEAKDISKDIINFYEEIAKIMPSTKLQISNLLDHFNDYHLNATLYSTSFLKPNVDVGQLQPLMIRVTKSSQAKKNSHDKLRSTIFNSFNDKLQLLEHRSDQQTQVGILLGSALLTIVTILTSAISRSVANTIQTAIAVSQKIAQGDLSIQDYEMPQDDTKELLGSLEIMRKNILNSQQDFIIAAKFNASMEGLDPLSDLKSGTSTIRELFNSPFVGLFLSSKTSDLECLHADSLDSKHLSPDLIHNIGIPLDSFQKAKFTRLTLDQNHHFEHILGTENKIYIDCHPIFNAETCVGVLVICHLSDPDERTQKQIGQCIGRLALKAHSHIIDQDRKVLLSSLEDRARELELLNEENIKISQLKSEFLACMSHEIRTPMNGVIGMLSIMEEGDLNETQQSNVSIAKECANSLLVLINDILDFSKIEAGKLSIKLIDFDLVREFDLIAQSLAQQAQNKGLELIIDLTEVPITHVKGDPNRLRQILVNITGNALKFTQHGEVIIKVKLAPIDAKRMLLTCSVSDTGIGIPSSQLENLFEPFTQADTSATREFGGTGLGLAISKQLCDLMGGSISVESQVGKGSTFSISLTVGNSNIATSTSPVPKIDDLDVVIIDESIPNRKVLRTYLTNWGVTTHCTQQIGEAMEMMEKILTQQKNKKVCVFIDLHILEYNDFGIVKKIKKNKMFSQVKFVIMTPICEARDLKFFVNLDFDTYIRKPVTIFELKQAISVATERKLLKNNIEAPQEEGNDKNTQLTEQEATQKVLLVEDNPINQRVSKKLLEKYGLAVQVANTGLDALTVMSTAKEFDLIFMDCQMPEMDGYEATRQIRSGAAGDSYKNITIIAITANAMKGDKEKCIDAGMNDYIAKPITRELLKEKLDQWL